MKPYPFDLLRHASPETGHDLLTQRSQSHQRTLAEDANRFDPDDGLETAIHTAIALGSPLLLTGDAGTGKTQTAYYVAHKLGLGNVLHFQVKSSSQAQDLLYQFDHVKYFRDSGIDQSTDAYALKEQSISEGVLWEALESDTTRVVLIDEIDKAPRDFPNDLLHEIDQMQFSIAELDNKQIGNDDSHRPLVFITSNSERRLPDAFLRRCVFYHVEFNERLLRRALKAHKKDFDKLPQGIIDLALDRFLELHDQHLRKTPATGEFLAWLRVMATLADTSTDTMHQALINAGDDLAKLPYIGVLLKNREDLTNVGNQRF